MAPSTGGTPDLLPQLERLQALLEAYDGDAVGLAAEIESQAAHTDFAQAIREIGERIDEFEFDEALERVNALREVMIPSTPDSATLT